MASENSSQGTPDQDLRAFFRNFEHSSATADDERLAAMYATSLLMAGPSGAQIVKASALVHALPKRRRLVESAGCTSTRLASLVETRLDDRYSIVRIEWQWRLEPRAGEPADITLPSSYIVERAGDALKIVCYIAHAAITAGARERRLRPA